ncbi:MAG: transcriptional regulator [Deltaproteobacteria bacterium CG12_big_fil_rev_8_21_14_0_65_43_10]|nr:MAG: transcriptional regulator [Deltaproteobacteria bacterium CG2_30_43_15]PIQ44983.1 MAG: transcriptional regulator [Deltaproteobacteria bacterium CG12_big_fil_rev_8_21_14_0_65_43_10]PIU84653.1 MAG: transcriptional regulator [Deltaproteobacteria bacterium CG06_land_8_20_14_3_00_44_19]PIX23979.1 MAG: transcriptional regulator [Deltaproteobacteria bacterium CG_4_8_14_3_um_filter_43_13]PIZ18352.1 MAG: transcriptional regulator [Deltaproteobacteria bacterium CG_4_10_14_0_8_um_filter_43_12]PJB3
MKEGNVILTPIPQADGKLKERPAIFLREMPPYRDLLVCGVSTQLHQYVKDFDEFISPADADFKSSCIRTKSLIRLGFLAVLPRHRVLGSIGFISAERHKRLLRKLSDYLTNSTQATG